MLKIKVDYLCHKNGCQLLYLIQTDILGTRNGHCVEIYMAMFLYTFRGFMIKTNIFSLSLQIRSGELSSVITQVSLGLLCIISRKCEIPIGGRCRAYCFEVRDEGYIGYGRSTCSTILVLWITTLAQRCVNQCNPKNVIA